jgi:TPP-dependent 2-oxoacid decarboxylase
MSTTVVQHVPSRLRDVGIRHVFGVPGDFSFPPNDALGSENGPHWIGCSGGLNAAYAADGYARAKGAGAVCTTYGVGELGASNAIAGSYAEHLPTRVQEISQFARLGLKPVIFVLNNGGYLIERLLSKDPASGYNDIARWRYADLPRALGCDDWMTARVSTCGELELALRRAEAADSAVYIEVVTAPDEAPPFSLRLQEYTRSMCRARPHC